MAHEFGYKAGDTLEVAGLEFYWSQEFDNISFEKVHIGNVLTEEDVEELAEFCISYQNRMTAAKEQDQLRLRLETEIKFYQHQISDTEYKYECINTWKVKLKEKQEELAKLNA